MQKIDNKSTTPKTTTNQLADIVNWLKNGDMVVLHDDKQNCIVFGHHDNPNIDLTTIRVVMVNCGGMPCLLDEEQWQWYIEDAGIQKV
jgi:hypothetical protein